MPKDEIVVEGNVLETFGNATFRIAVNDAHEVLAVPAGRIRLNGIHIVPGDKVRVVLSPYDLTRGRITWLIKEGNRRAQGGSRGGWRR